MGTIKVNWWSYKLAAKFREPTRSAVAALITDVRKRVLAEAANYVKTIGSSGLSYTNSQEFIDRLSRQIMGLSEEDPPKGLGEII